MIWLHGEATENGGAGPACDVPWDHSLDLGNRTLTYNWANRRPEGSDRAVVVSDVWTQGGCPLSYEIRASGWPIHVNGLGNLTIEVRDDGTVMVNGATAISQGQALHIQIHGISSFGGHLMGELNVENIGAWLTSGQSSRQ